MSTHIKFLQQFDKYLQESVIILIGPESYPLKRIMERYREKGFETKTFWADESPVEEVLKSLRSVSMFADTRKAVLVRGFLQWKNWKELLESIPSGSTVLLYDALTEEGDEKRLTRKVREWVKAAFRKKEVPTVILMPYLSREARIRWVVQKARGLGMVLDAERAALLVDSTGPDLHNLETELEKIFLGGPENMDKLVFVKEEESIFEIREALRSRDGLKMIKILQSAEPIPSIAFLQRTLLNSIYASSDIKERVKPPFMARKFAELGRFFYTKEMYDMLWKTLNAEKGYKSFHRGKVILFKLSGEMTR